MKNETTEYLAELAANALEPDLTPSVRVNRLRTLADLVADIRDAQKAASFRATVKDFYGMLQREGVIPTNVAAELPRIHVRNKIMLPAPEASVIDREDLPERERLMVELGARQGLRRVEIAQIHSRDVYRDSAGWVLIVHGKGSKDRVIPLHEDIADRIRANGPGWLESCGWLVVSQGLSAALESRHGITVTECQVNPDDRDGVPEIVAREAVA